MTKSNIAEVVSEWVEKALSLPFTIYCDLIPFSDTDGACVRHDPSPAAEKRFTDGSRFVSWNLTFYVRLKNAEQARETAKQITDKLDGATVIRDDGVSIDCEAVTLPQYIDTDSKEYTTYATAIKCEYLEPAETN
nr:MAG TPA: Minor capsid protein [Caudoviricetes sp.]